MLFNYRRRILDQFAKPTILLQTLLPRSTATFWAKSAALACAWTLGTLALMQPQGNAHYPEENLTEKAKPGEQQLVPIKRRAHEVIVLVDASASMATVDTRPGVSRLDYAKDIADQIIRRLDGQSASLYAFTSSVIRMSPPTWDYIFVRLMLREIHINEGETSGTNIFEAMAYMRDRFLKISSTKLKTLILLSDGGDTRIESLSGAPRREAIQTLVNLLGDPQNQSLRLYTIGLGSLKGGEIPKLIYEGHPVHSALQEDLLRELARRGRGTYFSANDNTALSISQDLAIAMQQDPPFLEEATALKALGQGGKQKIYDAYYQIPLSLALILLAFVLLWPDTKLERR
jgi:Ca-activated chloride channel family protein